MRHRVVGISTNHFQLGMKVFQTLVRTAHNAAFPAIDSISASFIPTKRNTILQAVAQFLRHRFQRMAF